MKRNYESNFHAAKLKTQSIGWHFILDIETENPIIDDGPELYALLNRAAQIAGMTVLGGEMREFEPQGVTAFVILAESHISAHSAPEHNHIALDLFTCGDPEAAESAVDWLAEKLGGAAVQHVLMRAI